MDASETIFAKACHWQVVVLLTGAPVSDSAKAMLSSSADALRRLDAGERSRSIFDLAIVNAGGATFLLDTAGGGDG